MEKKSKKGLIIGISSLLLVTLLLLGLTYAYYRTRIIGNTSNEPSISVQSKKMEITYHDGSAILSTDGKIEPGFTATKEFSVENTGSEMVNYSIMLDNMTNTFIRNTDWIFTLTLDGETIKSGTLPNSNAYLVNSTEIDSETTHEYVLTVKYDNPNENQSIDMGKNLSFRVNIADEVGTTLNSAADGTLLAAIARDNVIQKPLTTPGREPSAVKLYEDGDLSESQVMNVSKAKDRFWVYGSGYTFDELTGKYTLTGVTVGKYSEIYNSLSGKYIVGSNYGKVSVSDEELADQIKTEDLIRVYKIANVNYNDNELTYQVIEPNPLYGESVFASTEGDNGETYYYRGLVENNYVTYSNMCWRIVRVMENGDIKLALADTNNPCGTQNGYSKDDADSAFAVDDNGNIISDVSYLFDAMGDVTDLIFKNSDIAAALNTWSTREGYVIDTTKLSTTPNWCVDTSETSYDFGIIFGAGVRLEIPATASPTLKCAVSSDNESKIALLTADELVFAGSTTVGPSPEPKHYFYHLKTNAKAFNSFYWTMTPFILDDDGSTPILFEVYYNGELSETADISVTNDLIRPVVVLSSNVTIKDALDTTSNGAHGTIDNPYVIS